MTDLALIATEELLKELQGRFEHILISGVKSWNEDEEVTAEVWDGNPSVILGLATRVIYLINKDLDGLQKEADSL